ncbi:MAG: DNA repair and recombination protein RadA [Candidatus Micrarchaeota archaeon]|nr:DNA repair and recombination protein RadA [Candidatus Micrarchaeota archaeon]MDE1847631.1 DNA repair and recombination protein RadA [Candidatus Micrarchaeota archaeon]MDE1864452.1 DNA repair and recombination protein RadA [Candidatus Micrarchaeota archaeon]
MAKEVRVKEVEDLPGIGPTSAQKLRDAGYDTLDKVAAALPSELSDATGLSTEVAKKAIEAAKAATTLVFETGTEAYAKHKELGKITTGSKGFDELLGGGAEAKAITEAYGRFAAGKSQVGFQLSVNVQLPVSKGGMEGGVLFIDTEGTFSPDRIESIAKAAGLDPKAVLENIFLVRALNTEQQVLAVERADKLIREKNIKLIVVDSITSLFRAEFLGRGTLNERQQKLNAHIHRLQMLADTHSIAVYITNQVMDNPGILFGDPTTPIGGNILAHAAKTRLYMRKGKEEKRIVRLVDSPSQPEGECVIKITTEGIKD